VWNGDWRGVFVIRQEGSVCNGDRKGECNVDRIELCVMGQEGNVCK
jgi:hypothetical protein